MLLGAAGLEDFACPVKLLSIVDECVRCDISPSVKTECVTDEGITSDVVVDGNTIRDDVISDDILGNVVGVILGGDIISLKREVV